MPLLFSPIQIGPFHLENRIVVPPMATFGHQSCAGSGLVADSMVQHYREIAQSKPGTDYCGIYGGATEKPARHGAIGHLER